MGRFFIRICRLALGIVFAFNCVTAVSVSASSYIIAAESQETAEVGDIITVDINISSVGVYGGNFTLVYDSELLSPVSAEKGALVNSEGLTASVNGACGDNFVRASWAGGREITASGCICTLTFECVSEGTAVFYFAEANIFEKDGSAAEAVFTPGSTVITAAENPGDTTEPVTEEGALIYLSAPESCKTASSAEMKVVMAAGSSSCGGNAVIEYDSTLFKISGESLGEGLSENAVVSMNRAYSENSLKISWADNREYTEETVIAVITFEALGPEGRAEFDISSAFLSDGEGGSIKCRTSGAGVDVCDKYMGDADGNGEINLLDAAALLKYVENSEAGLADTDAADVNGDGIITRADAAYIIKYISGIITEFP